VISAIVLCITLRPAENARTSGGRRTVASVVF